MPAGPIPFSAIDRFAVRYDVANPDEFDRLVALIGEMEDAYLSFQAHRRQRQDDLAEAERQEAEGRAKGSGRRPNG